MPGDINQIKSSYLNDVSLKQAVDQAGVTYKPVKSNEGGYKIYQVKADSTILRKVGFVVGLVLTGFIPFIILRFVSESFRDYFLGKRKVVKVPIDPLNVYSTTRAEATSKIAQEILDLNPQEQNLITKWRNSDAVQHYRADLADGEAAIKEIRRLRNEVRGSKDKIGQASLKDKSICIINKAEQNTSNALKFNVIYSSVLSEDTYQAIVLLGEKGFCFADNKGATYESLRELFWSLNREFLPARKPNEQSSSDSSERVTFPVIAGRELSTTLREIWQSSGATTCYFPVDSSEIKRIREEHQKSGQYYLTDDPGATNPNQPSFIISYRDVTGSWKNQQVQLGARGFYIGSFDRSLTLDELVQRLANPQPI